MLVTGMSSKLTMSRTKRLTIGIPATGSKGFGVVSVCGRKREPRPAMGTIMFIFLVYSGAPKPRCSSGGVTEFIGLFPCNRFMFGDNQLRNAIAMIDRKRRV
jgi:hypothetical protein